MQTELRGAIGEAMPSGLIAPQEIDRRRNFAIISHPDAGKTTLTERWLLRIFDLMGVEPIHVSAGELSRTA